MCKELSSLASWQDWCKCCSDVLFFCKDCQFCNGERSLLSRNFPLTIRRWKPTRSCSISPWVLELCFLFHVLCRDLTNSAWKLMAKRKDLRVVVWQPWKTVVCVCVSISFFPQNNYNQKCLIRSRGPLEETLSSQSSSPYFLLLFPCPLPFPTAPRTTERF